MTKEKALEIATQKVNVHPHLFVEVRKGTLCAMKHNWLYVVEYMPQYNCEPAVYYIELCNNKVVRVY